MRNKIMVAAIASALAAPAAFAGDKVDIEFAGNKERMDVGDLKTMSVCSLKQRIAKKFDLKIKKFDLKRKHGVKLNADKTLYGAGVRNYNRLEIISVNHSFQC